MPPAEGSFGYPRESPSPPPAPETVGADYLGVEALGVRDETRARTQAMRSGPRKPNGVSVLGLAQVALAALPCLASVGSKVICSSAESLFEQLLSLDGDGVWLLLLQTLDIAEALPARGGSGGRALKAGGSALPHSRGQDEHASATHRRRKGREPGPGGGGRDTEADDDGPSSELPRISPEAFLPFPPTTVVPLWRGRPCALAESTSVLPGSLARDCAPAAARLLAFVRSDAAPERM